MGRQMYIYIMSDGCVFLIGHMVNVNEITYSIIKYSN